jgi:RNase adaptor protein for sRNA GlmZ degradation
MSQEAKTNFQVRRFSSFRATGRLLFKRAKVAAIKRERALLRSINALRDELSSTTTELWELEKRQRMLLRRRIMEPPMGF